ncbi:MAG: hypothetical protein PHO56_00640 [Patescibacteria group bacterium]|nr:hypothetical protein [Patescibacteria group bacterium]
MRSKVLCLCVGFGVVAAMLFAGCAKSNPVSSSYESADFGLSAAKVSSVVPNGATDTVGSDTGLVNDNWIFSPIDKNGKKDSVQSCSYDYGDESASDSHLGLATGTHRFTSVGKYTVTLYVYMKSGVIQKCGIYIITVSSRIVQPTTTKDSVFMFLSSTPVGAGTNVFSITFGTLVLAVTPASGVSNPFQEGYEGWSVIALLNNEPKSANGRLFQVTQSLEGGKFYDVGLGKTWNGTDNSSVWLSPVEQAGNRYYNPAANKHIMSFYVGYNGYPYPLDSIPADSGRGTIVTPPVTIDTTHPGTYGDVGANWRVRFQEVIHSNVAGGLDSVIIFCSLHGLEACSTSTVLMQTNITGKSQINMTRLAGKLYAYAIVAIAEISNADGLIWNYTWGTCAQSDNSGSNYWSYAVNGVVTAFQGKWAQNYSVSLPKKAAGASGRLVSVR